MANPVADRLPLRGEKGQNALLKGRKHPVINVRFWILDNRV
jgi:hypothetical protein